MFSKLPKCPLRGWKAASGRLWREHVCSKEARSLIHTVDASQEKKIWLNLKTLPTSGRVTLKASKGAMPTSIWWKEKVQLTDSVSQAWMWVFLTPDTHWSHDLRHTQAICSRNTPSLCFDPISSHFREAAKRNPCHKELGLHYGYLVFYIFKTSVLRAWSGTREILQRANIILCAMWALAEPAFLVKTPLRSHAIL